jgi:hypothetical protein
MMLSGVVSRRGRATLLCALVALLTQGKCFGEATVILGRGLQGLWGFSLAKICAQTKNGSLDT